MKKLSRENLLSMTVKQLRFIDIRDGETEKLVQEIINLKTQDTPIIIEKPIRVPDIKNKTEEEFWQKQIDEQKARAMKANPETVTELHIPATDIPQITLPPINPIEPASIPETIVTATPIKRFCEHCDSKGVRHKKECPTLVKTNVSSSPINHESNTYTVG